MNLGKIINENILWLVPILSILLTIIVTVVATPDTEHLSLKDLFSIGINLCISAITILITNYRSSTTAWLILFYFVIILSFSILTRKFTWKERIICRIISSILILIVGIMLCYIAIEHANDVLYCISG